MRYGSVCSGVEAATVAWHGLGWEPQWFSEIEKFPSAVLQHHYPDVPNYGDMTQFKEWPNDRSIDLLVGGTPCQSFSVAGLRKGLDDPRGNLMLTYLAIAAQYRPKWLVWENVPGVLASNRGRDFGSFLLTPFWSPSRRSARRHSGAPPFSPSRGTPPAPSSGRPPTT